MQFDVIIETMRSMPSASFALVLCLTLTAAFLVNCVLDAGYYTTLASIPVLLMSGMLGNAVLEVNGIVLAPDRASNIALSATLGFIICAGSYLTAYRIWSRLHDKR